MCFGDSITQDVEETNGYSYWIGQITGATMINQGYGGTTINSHVDPNFDAFGVARLIDAKLSGDWSLQETAITNWTNSEDSADNSRAISFTTQINKLKAIDFNDVYACTLAYGANSNGATIGTAEPDSTLTYFAGSISYVIKRLQENYPQLRIVILGPMYKESADPLLDRSLELIEGCKLAAEYNNVPWYDTYHNAGFNKYNFMTTYSIDGKHPNDLGKKRLGERFSAFLVSHI